MKIHVNQDNIIDGLAFNAPMKDGIDIDATLLPEDFAFFKYKYIDGQFVKIDSSRAMSLEEAVSNKLKELSIECEKNIINGITIDGQNYSMTDKDQINLEMLKGIIKDGATEVSYHADDESCRIYTSDEFMKIYLACMRHKIHHITYYNQLKRYVKSLDNKDEIMSISYGQELTGEYLDTYNEIYNWNISLQGLYS